MTFSKTKHELPREIYIPFVMSLFEGGGTLMFGVLAQALVAALCYYNTGYVAYLVLGVALIVVGAARFASIRHVSALPVPTTMAEAYKREVVYIIGGSAHGFVLGLLSLCAIYLYHDEFAEVATITVSLGTVTAIPGRNYGSSKMVVILIAAVTLPICLGFFLRGEIQYFLLGILTLPFFLVVRTFAANVRHLLASALKEQQAAQRFDRALNTMTHGLLMLDAHETIVVANAEAVKLFQATSAEKLQGRTFKALLQRGVAAGFLDKRDAKYISQQLTRALHEGRNRKVLIKLIDGRYFELSAREGDDDLSVITFEDVTARIASQEKIRHMARFDSLTGLANRAHFQELVTDALATGDPQRNCAMVVLDLDDFKSINDTLGHPVGDGLIFAFAERLAENVSDEVRISRFGGDEFLLFIDDVEDAEALRTMISQIFASLLEPVDVAGNLMHIQVSAGAVLMPVRETSVDSLIVKADLALYKAKERGKGCWQLFEDSLDRAFRERQKLKSELRGAVSRGELLVLYQPIVDARTLGIASCEALCRWHHPQLGLVPPGVFIPLAEEIGIISEISAFVMKRATADCTELPHDVRVSVNLSAKDFRSREVVDVVRRSLELSGLAPERLEVEVTETAIVDDKSKTWTYLQEIKDIGVQIALDDFGTGYSNLGYLNALPLDKIKVDRSFLADLETNPRSLELLKGVVDLTRRLGLKVTIEGVETENQFRLLVDTVDPDFIQGFLFGTPLTKAGIVAMIEAIRPLTRANKKSAVNQ